MTSSQGGSYPGPSSLEPLHLIGQEWVEHGYRFSPIFDDIEPCPICDAPNQVCTEHNTVPYQESGNDGQA